MPRAAGALALALVAAPAAGQGPAPVSFPGPIPRSGAGIPGLLPTASDPAVVGGSVPAFLATPPGAFGASLLLPGTGQAALGLRRWPLYVAAEAGLWWASLDARSDFRALRGRYRDLAWDVARLQDGGPRVDGSWGYYETMSRYAESGRYDADPGPGLQPETDASTYNGTVWALARGLYLPGGQEDPHSPRYGDALAYYAGRAAGPGFLWSWSGAEADHARFRDLIGRADDENRRVTTTLGLILANHLVSAIDALVVARLRSGWAPELRSSVEPGPRGPRWRVTLHLARTGTE